MADVRDASSLHMTVLSDISWRDVARGGFRWSHRPSGGAPGCDGQCAGRSQVAVALSAVTALPEAVGFFSAATLPTIPVLGASGPGPMGERLEALHGA